MTSGSTHYTVLQHQSVSQKHGTVTEGDTSSGPPHGAGFCGRHLRSRNRSIRSYKSCVLCLPHVVGCALFCGIDSVLK